MPNFAYPASAGGGGGGGGIGSPVLGGSGVQYASVALAQAGETEVVVATFIAQAGTVAGSVVGTAALSGVDDFYNDFFLIDEDTTPANGLQCRIARVIDYDGTTKVLTIDKPWNFSGESSLRLVSPIRLTLLGDLIESPTFTKNAVFNLAGHRLQGQVDQTAGSLLWIHGGEGYITDGVQKTNIGVLWIDGCSVSARRGTIYAVLMTNGSNLGRCILNRCEFSGVVASRRGRVGWEIGGCRNYGLPEGTPADRNVPYRLVESVAGVAVVVTQASWEIEGEWSGAAFYSENSITGATAVIAGQMRIKIPGTLTRTLTGEQPSYAFLYCAVAGATLTMTWSGGYSVMDVLGSNEDSASTANPPDVRSVAGLVMTVDFTGTLNVNGGTTSGAQARFSGSTNFAEVLVLGTATMTGSITTTNMNALWALPRFSWSKINLQSVVSGTVAAGATNTVSYARRCFLIVNALVAQTLVPTITASGTMTVENVEDLRVFDVGNVSTGTWTSSSIIVGTVSGRANLIILFSTVTAGTFVVSGSATLSAIGNAGSSTHDLISIPAGPTCTISGAINLKGGRATSASIGGAGVVTISGNILIEDMTLSPGIPPLVNGSNMTLTGTYTIRNCHFTSTASFLFQTSGTLVFSGVMRIVLCSWDDDCELFDEGPGNDLTWPPTMFLDTCVIAGTLAGMTDGLATTAMQIRNCIVTDIFSFSGDRFSSLEVFESSFHGNLANESVTATGARPAIYRYWKCDFRALNSDLIPEIINEYVTLPAAAALTAGQLVSVNAAGQAENAAAASVVDGVVLEAVAALGNPTIVVTDGKVFVDTSGVAAGDYMVSDAAGTPTQAITAALGALVLGQTIGRALEATGATRAGESHSIVRVR